MAEFTNELMKWLGGGHSPWHTVDMAAHWLTERGFEPLALNKPSPFTGADAILWKTAPFWQP